MNQNFKSYLNTLVLAVLAGGAIGIGGTIFLSLDNKIVGAVMFSVGLYLICVHKLNLFTGKVGYAVISPLSYWIDLTIIWLGNLIGTGLSAVMVRMTRISGLAEKAASVCAVKNQDSLMSLFVLGIFCGLLMYAAVEGYKRVQNPLILCFCVAVFILCGFEHCIADMFYYSLAGGWNGDVIVRILVITVGNSLGGMLLPLADKLRA